MRSLNFSNLANYGSDGNIDELLEKFDSYIVALARKMVPRSVAHPGSFSDVVDELAQRTLIKLWKTTQKRRIVNTELYIRRIMHNESIDVMRSNMHALPLLTDEDGELYQGNPLILPGEGIDDRARELEHKEVVAGLIEEAADALLTLSPRQNFAMICHLLDRVDDLLQQVCALKPHNLDIETKQWPGDEEEGELNGSLSAVARQICFMNEHNMRGSPGDVLANVA
jgi:DNA-directed RNA polymerase specialized sigma24 family protein